MLFDHVIKILSLFRESTSRSNIMSSHVDDYLILPKVFLESDQFGDRRPVVQIDTGSLELGLDYMT